MSREAPEEQRGQEEEEQGRARPLPDPEKGKPSSVLKKLREVKEAVKIYRYDLPIIGAMLSLVEDIRLELGKQDAELFARIAEDIRCKPVGHAGGLMLRHGDRVEISIRGRNDRTVTGTFKCINDRYGDIIIQSGNREINIRLNAIKTITRIEREARHDAIDTT